MFEVGRAVAHTHTCMHVHAREIMHTYIIWFTHTHTSTHTRARGSGPVCSHARCCPLCTLLLPSLYIRLWTRKLSTIKSIQKILSVITCIFSYLAVLSHRAFNLKFDCWINWKILQKIRSSLNRNHAESYLTWIRRFCHFEAAPAATCNPRMRTKMMCDTSSTKTFTNCC